MGRFNQPNTICEFHSKTSYNQQLRDNVVATFPAQPKTYLARVIAHVPPAHSALNKHAIIVAKLPDT